MQSSFTNFLLGLFCTSGLFVLSLLIVVGGKVIYLSLKERFFPKKETPVAPPPKVDVVKRHKKPKTIPKPVRSIEIDPEQVDRIYVRKTS